MKKCLIILFAFASTSVFAQERCHVMTRWGQCTNVSVPSDTVCKAHQYPQCSWMTPHGRCTNDVAFRTDTVCFQHQDARAKAARSSPLPVKSSSERTTNIPTSYSTRSTVRSTPSSTTKTTRSSCQCIATTKKGTRCSRTSSPGSSYCWQHSN